MPNFAKFVQEAKRLMNVSPDVIRHGERLLENPDYVERNQDQLTAVDRKAMMAAVLHKHILPQISTPEKAKDFLSRLSQLSQVLRQQGTSLPSQQLQPQTRGPQTPSTGSPQPQLMQNTSPQQLSTGEWLNSFLQ
jgi:hypothetical protein